MAATRKQASAPPGRIGPVTELWLAGLGAFKLAGDVGGRVFQSLVERGREQEEVNKAWLGRLGEDARTLKGKAGKLLTRVATPFEEGLVAALHRLGVPKREEFLALTHEVEALVRHVTPNEATGDKAKAAPRPRPGRKHTRTAVQPAMNAPSREAAERQGR